MATREGLVLREKEGLILTSGASGRISALFSLRALKTLLVFFNTVVLLLLFPFRKRTVLRLALKPAASSSRRALAIRRVLEDRDHSSLILRDYSLLPTTRGDTIFTQSWIPLSLNTNINFRGVVLLMHGLNEHSSRYSHFAKQLNANGFKVYGMDWVGVPTLASAVSRKEFSIAVCEIEMVKILATSVSSLTELFEFHLCNKVTCQAPIPSNLRVLCLTCMIKIRSNSNTIHGLAHWCDPPRFFMGQCPDLICPVNLGHGGSDGLHAYVHSLDDAVSDMKVFLEKILTENPGLPCFCFGHSTGAAITLKALLDPKVEARIAGAVLTSPAVGVAPSHPILTVLAPIVSFLLPTYQFSSAYKKGLPVSRDPEALIAKYSDPLVCTGSIRIRTGYEILRITSYLQQNLRKVRAPFLVLHGTADSVTDPVASQKLYEEASSSDKTIKLYDGFLHDLLFEPERDAITQDIIQWLNSRT
ncbi:Serine aminopeptidase, S33 [Sesbania bispinosa]|nr:Serine aminopeptidase, S33 [Sesbania bispinosa]